MRARLRASKGSYWISAVGPAERRERDLELLWGKNWDGETGRPLMVRLGEARVKVWIMYCVVY